MKDEVATLNQMVEEGMEALEQLEEFDNRSKFKTWIDKYPEINEKMEEIEKEGGELSRSFISQLGFKP